MTTGDERPTLPAQLLIAPALTSTAGLLLGLAAFMLGEDGLGIGFYPAIAVAVVVWLYGQAKLLSTIKAFAQAQREKQESDSEG
jgi:hypothetical protein